MSLYAERFKNSHQSMVTFRR